MHTPSLTFSSSDVVNVLARLQSVLGNRDAIALQCRSTFPLRTISSEYAPLLTVTHRRTHTTTTSAGHTFSSTSPHSNAPRATSAPPTPRSTSKTSSTTTPRSPRTPPPSPARIPTSTCSPSTRTPGSAASSTTRERLASQTPPGEYSSTHHVPDFLHRFHGHSYLIRARGRFCECKDPTFFWYSESCHIHLRKTSPISAICTDTGHPTEHVHRLLARAIEAELLHASRA